MKKWNCNIVANMYDRVIRRKFGLLCNDNTSNEDFINSYINRLDCTPINLQCVNSQPCPDSTIITTCNLIVNVSVIINQDGNYVFTPTVLNGTAPYSYNWNYSTFEWQLISNISGVLILKPLLIYSGTIDSTVTLNVTDDIKCTAIWKDKIDYRGGCTDPEAVNYDPTATIDNGTCYYEPLILITGYTCDFLGNGQWCATVTGGVPPYTLVGSPSSPIANSGDSYCEIILNGNSWNCYVIDSASNVTPIQTGTIICPFDCETVKIESILNVVCLTDVLGHNTGQAQLFITPSGGTAPYSIIIFINGDPGIPFIDGMTLNDGDTGYYTVTDANGCTTNADFSIDCPFLPAGCDVDCEGLLALFNSSGTYGSVTLVIEDISLNAGLDGWTIQYKLDWGLFALPACLNEANIALSSISVTNESGGLSYQSTTPGIGGSCNPCIYTSALTEYTLYAEIISNFCVSGSGLRLLVPPSNPTLYLNLDFTFTITLPNGNVCQFCADNILFNTEYDPCTVPYIPNSISETISFPIILCP
jgi:hypothetical protein